MVWFVAVTTFVLGICLGMCIVAGRREPTGGPSSSEIDGKRRFSTSFRVPGTRKTVMDVLTSFSRYPEWIGDVRECTVYAHVDREYRVRLVIPILWFTVVTHLVHTITEDSMSWCLDTDQPDTMFRVNEGQWHVCDEEGGTCMVTYSVQIQPVLPLPTHAIDILQQEASRRAVDWLPRALRQTQTIPDNDVPTPVWYMRCLTCVPGKKNV